MMGMMEANATRMPSDPFHTGVHAKAAQNFRNEFRSFRKQGHLKDVLGVWLVRMETMRQKNRINTRIPKSVKRFSDKMRVT